MTTKQVTVPSSLGKSVRHWIGPRIRFVTPFLTLGLLVIFFTLFSQGGRFFTLANLRNILQQAAALAIMTTGVTFVLLAGEIDLSIASIATMSGVMGCFLFAKAHFPGTLAALATLLFTIFLGWVNGWVTTRFTLPSFMTTLAMMQIGTGLSLYVTKGRPFYENDVPPIMLTLGGGYIGAVPIILLTGIVALGIGHVVLSYTRFGRYIFMVGGNKEAAELSGISSNRIRMASLIVCGGCAGLAGLINTGRIGSGQPAGFDAMLLDSIAAVVLGGTSLFGGEGSIPNTIIGLLIFGVLKNGLNMVNIDTYLKTFVTGCTLLVALVINVYSLRLGTREAAED